MWIIFNAFILVDLAVSMLFMFIIGEFVHADNIAKALTGSVFLATDVIIRVLRAKKI